MNADNWITLPLVECVCVAFALGWLRNSESTYLFYLFIKCSLIHFLSFLKFSFKFFDLFVWLFDCLIDLFDWFVRLIVWFVWLICLIYPIDWLIDWFVWSWVLVPCRQKNFQIFFLFSLFILEFRKFPSNDMGGAWSPVIPLVFDRTADV